MPFVVAHVKLTGDWKSLKAIITPRKTVEEVTQAVLKAIATIMKERATGDAFAGLEENAELTAAIKGDNKPGVDSGELKKSLKVIYLPRKRGVWVGIASNSPAAAYAKLVNDGSTIQVTEEMRGMFLVLWKCSMGHMEPERLTGRAKTLWKMMPGGWLPLSDDTTEIVIPARPFMARALEVLQKSGDLDKTLLGAIDKGLRSRARSKK